MQVIAVVLGLFLLLGAGGGALVGCPRYNVYTSRLSGEAQLAEAESARQVTVRQAQADLDASRLRAQGQMKLPLGKNQNREGI